ncbi:MAG: ROK family protein, partial [Oscillospiraceae bacterium]|nr:ROK family protein [Oscillospiraceae bacterium]
MNCLYYLGVDLGGTNTAAAVADETGRLYAKTKEKTPKTGGPDAVAECVCSAAREAAALAGVSLDQFRSVGIGAPGIVEPLSGRIEHWSGRSFQKVPFGGMVGKRLHLPVFLENDANAAALGEFAAGAGQGAGHMVMVTLGTGVGCGILMGGKLYGGCNHAAGEMGHVVLVPNGIPCSCGRRGCFELYATAAALVRQTKEKMGSAKDSALWQLAGGKLSGVSGRTAFEAM